MRLKHRSKSAQMKLAALRQSLDDRRAIIHRRVMPPRSQLCPNATYPHLPSGERSRRLRRNLSRWFAIAQRSLPWRHDRDPYHIWVSEIMLQQTQVVSVIPFYERFVKAFPTIRRLAQAK